MNRILILTTIIGAVFLGGYLVFAPESKPHIPVIDPDDPRQTTLGQGLYQTHCAECHGVNLEGQPDWRVPNEDGTLPAPPHDRTGHTWHHDDRLLFDYTKRGGQAVIGDSGFTSAMPGFADLMSDQEIAAVLAFIKSRWTQKIRDRQATLNTH